MPASDSPRRGGPNRPDRPGKPPAPAPPPVPEMPAPEPVELTEADLVAVEEQSRAQRNGEKLRTRAKNALTGNKDYLDAANPNAQQTAAQVKALTRQVNALIRLTVNELDADD